MAPEKGAKFKLATLHELVRQAAQSFENRVAVIYDDGNTVEKLSYQQSMDLASFISSSLREHGTQNKTVGVYMTSDLLVPSILLGILEVPANFACLDVTAPWSWNAQFAGKCPITYLLTLANLSTVEIEQDFEEITSFQCKTTKFILMKQRNPGKDPPRSYAESLAYCVRTSGSTGLPKVVRVPHSCIVPNIKDFRSLFGVCKRDILLQMSPMTFDPSVIEIFVALSSGASLLIIPSKFKSIPSHLTHICFIRNRVTIIQSTPAVFRRFDLESLQDSLLHRNTSLRILALGGEPFPSAKCFKQWKANNPPTLFFNLYGITEVSCWASVRQMDSLNASLEPDLGDALTHTHFEVRDENNQPITEGLGLLYLGGKERVCYLDEETEDAAKILLRDTGDLVELRKGKLYYIARKDDTIKRHGKRLSLSTVESNASSLEYIETAVAVAEEECVWLFVQTQKPQSISENTLDQVLREKLPSYACPNHIICVEDWPLTSHGKVDKKALLQKGKASLARRTELTPGTTEKNNGSTVKGLWATFTSSEPRPGDNFILSGADSFGAVNFTQRLEKLTGCQFPLLTALLMDKTFTEVLEYVESCGDVVTKELMPFKRRTSTENPIEKKLRLDPPSLVLQNTCRLYRRGVNPNKIVPLSNHGCTEVQAVKLVVSWKYDLGKCVDASPLLVEYEENDAFLYVGSHSHSIAALDLQGKERWRTELPDRIESSATLADCNGIRRIYVGCYDGRLYGLDAKSGAIERRFLTGDTVKCSPIAYGSLVFCGSHDGCIYCLDDETGEQVWRTQLGKGSVFASPVLDYASMVLYGAALDGRCVALEGATGDLLWHADLGKPVFGSPALLQKRVLFPCVNGKLYCFNAQGLQEWTFTTQGPIYSSVCVKEIAGLSVILFGCHDHQIYCLHETGQLAWQYDAGAAIYATPFVFQPLVEDQRSAQAVVMIVNVNGDIQILDLGHGKVLGRHQLPGEVFSSPLFYQNRLVVGCRDNYVYCLSVGCV